MNENATHLVATTIIDVTNIEIPMDKSNIHNSLEVKTSDFELNDHDVSMGKLVKWLFEPKVVPLVIVGEKGRGASRQGGAASGEHGHRAEDLQLKLRRHAVEVHVRGYHFFVHERRLGAWLRQQQFLHLVSGQNQLNGH